MNYSRGEFNFVLLFAIFAGVAILILAIYGASQFASTGRFQTSTLVAKQLDILTDPFQAGFASAQKNEISFNQNITIKSSCENFTEFGSNDLSVLIDMDLGQEKYGTPIKINDKYIFSSEYISGRKIYSLSKSFSFPFKVSDYLIFFSEEDHFCLEDSPDWFKQQLQNLEIPVLKFRECKNNEYYTQVCFSDPACDIYVSGGCNGPDCENEYDIGAVSKEGIILYYQKDLLLPAIFSNPSIYNCNVNRLLQKASFLTDIYSEKALILNQKDCINYLQSDLDSFKQQIDSNADIRSLHSIQYNLLIKNREGSCRVW